MSIQLVLGLICIALGLTCFVVWGFLTIVLWKWEQWDLSRMSKEEKTLYKRNKAIKEIARRLHKIN